MDEKDFAALDAIGDLLEAKRQREIPIPNKIKRDLQDYLAEISRKYWQSIPLKDISQKLQDNGYVLKDVEEGGLMLLGRDGRANLELLMGGEPVKSMLVISWHKMENTGNYEITAYLS